MSCLNWLVFAHEKSCEARTDWKRSRVKIVICLHIEHTLLLSCWVDDDDGDPLHGAHTMHAHTRSHKQVRIILHNRIETSFLKWKSIAFHPSGSLILMNIFAYRRISWTVFTVQCYVVRTQERERLSRVCRYTHSGYSYTFRGVRVIEVE